MNIGPAMEVWIVSLADQGGSSDFRVVTTKEAALLIAYRMAMSKVHFLPHGLHEIAMFCDQKSRSDLVLKMINGYTGCKIEINSAKLEHPIA